MKSLKSSYRQTIMKSLYSLLIVALINGSIYSSLKAQNTPENDNKKHIKIALLLDTSNSMDGLIEQAKSQLWQLVNELAQAECDGIAPSLNIALYEYGNSNLPASEGYIRQVTPLTDDLDQISEDLFSLRTNGGNEFCGQVIQTAIAEQEWSRSNDDLQIIFIAGNEPFTQGKVNYKSACLDAKERNIIINTIHCGDFDKGISGMWKDGADRANGQYMCIEQNRKTVYIASPYDEQITKLNSELNNTYISYGDLGRAKKETQMKQDSNAASYSQANSVKRAVSKSSHFYKNASWDLVDASEKEDFKLENIKDQQLPEEMQGKTLIEKEKYIAQKAKERAQIKHEINALNKKRIHFVNEKKKESGNDDMLDKAMIKAIKAQAASKSFEFKSK